MVTVINFCSLLKSEGVYSVVESGDADIYFLHSLVNMSDQKAVFDPSPEGHRKIILSTNIGETSITINDVVYVVDTGKINMTSFDPIKNMTSLKGEWVSQSNAKQRAGRAGRVREGICYHLFSLNKKERYHFYQLYTDTMVILFTECHNIFK